MFLHLKRKNKVNVTFRYRPVVKNINLPLPTPHHELWTPADVNAYDDDCVLLQDLDSRFPPPKIDRKNIDDFEDAYGD